MKLLLKTKKIILGCGLAEKAIENSDEIYTELLYL